MTVAFEEKAVLEFKGRMLMMTVLLLKDLDPNTLHRQVSQRLEDAAQWLRDAPVVVDLAQPEGADQVALMAAVDTLRGLGVNLVALARNEHLDSDTAAMLGLGSISLAGGRDVPRSAEPAPQAEQPADAGHTLVIDQPVRSGQQIYSRGDLIVLAPVSTGAELLAAGTAAAWAAASPSRLGSASSAFCSFFLSSLSFCQCSTSCSFSRQNSS